MEEIGIHLPRKIGKRSPIYGVNRFNTISVPTVFRSLVFSGELYMSDDLSSMSNGTGVESYPGGSGFSQDGSVFGGVVWIYDDLQSYSTGVVPTVLSGTNFLNSGVFF